MESEFEKRIRDLLAGQIGRGGGAEPSRIEMSGVTIVEVRVERMVLVVDPAKDDAA